MLFRIAAYIVHLFAFLIYVGFNVFFEYIIEVTMLPEANASIRLIYNFCFQPNAVIHDWVIPAFLMFTGLKLGIYLLAFFVRLKLFSEVLIAYLAFDIIFLVFYLGEIIFSLKRVYFMTGAYQIILNSAYGFPVWVPLMFWVILLFIFLRYAYKFHYSGILLRVALATISYFIFK